ncbi:MAG TPA: response regulator transcription factor [Burkholderiaceae bacterium]|nr:response regulator transcription factor [Burkholderiaceae bacterium]
MATVIVVEPNALLRLGILQLVQKMTFDITGEGIDYAQLFNGMPNQQGMDLMLLSVPDAYDRMVELVNAAQQGYSPRRILLLSDTPILPYSLLNLPPVLGGYISKYSSPDVLTAAITLVLAGGKCFPSPDLAIHPEQRESESHPPAGAAPRRRWYDKGLPPPKLLSGETQPDNLLTPAEPRQMRGSDHPPTVPFEAGEPQPLSPSLIASEAEMLSLTPRQYEVLALLARGYPIKSVSRELNISVATTKAHTETLYQRLSVHNRNAAVYAAFSRGATLGWRKADPVNGKQAKQPRS